MSASDPETVSIPPVPASWMWVDGDVDSASQLAQFRLAFQASGAAYWLGFADSNYTVFCNGKPAGVGPVTGIHTQPRLCRHDLGPHLVAGRNVLALEVWFEGRELPTFDMDTFRAGVIGWLVTPSEIIATGSRWKAQRAATPVTARPDKRGFAAKRIVICDLRGEPSDWFESGFDDSAWPAASVGAAHPCPDRPGLRVSALPPMTHRPRRPQQLIDAGIARDGCEVQAADDVAVRMHAQRQTSTVRPIHVMGVLSPDEREAQIAGLPASARTAELGWADPFAEPAWPLRMPACDGDFYLTCDFGLQTSGQLWLDVESGDELTVDLGYADHLQQGRVNPTTQGHCYADRLIVSPGRHRVHVPHERGWRYLQCSFSGSARVHDICLYEHVYPHDGVRRFSCSDATLNGIWEMARSTLHQCSLWSHVDNARRERQGWGGLDLYAQAHGFFHVYGDLRLTRKMLEDFLDCFDAQGFIPSFFPSTKALKKWLSAHDLWFPACCWDYLLYSDDRALAPRLLRASQAVLDYYTQQTDGELLGRAHERACRWSEWNMNAAGAVSTWENLLAVVAWRSVASMQDYLQQDGGPAARARASALAEAINRRLWHGRHKALAQGTHEDGSLTDFCGQMDNAFALLNDILDGERRQDAIRFCAGASGTWPTSRSGWQGWGQGERVRHDPRKPVVAGTPFASSLCAKAICRLQSPARAIEYLRSNFGAMIDEGEGTLWEMWPIFIREQTSATCFSQGYGSHVAATLIGQVLGLTLSEPGGRRVHWNPTWTGLEWIQGRIETAHGPVSVRCEGDQLHFTVPAGVTLSIQTAAADMLVAGPVDSGSATR